MTRRTVQMQIKHTQYQIKETYYLRYCGTPIPRYEPQYRIVVLGVPLRWKNFYKDLDGLQGLVWFKQRCKAEHYLSVMQARACK